MALIQFLRRFYGHDRDNTPMLATVIRGTIIPDYEFYYLDKYEMNQKYGWKKVIIATFVHQKDLGKGIIY